MAPTEMQTYAGRLASFDGPKQVNKRRASAQKKKQATSSSWPHERPVPEELAKAGFFYKPSSSSLDSVTCFLCEKALDGWDAEDNPALEHLNHVPDCGWAINCCIEQLIEDMDSSDDDPLSEKMTEARRATYKDWWPHESKKGWKCKIKKMVEAGWVYTPIPEADDCVTCFYCQASLEGWEPKDDPWHEHHRRAPDCHFFELIEQTSQLKKPKKPKRIAKSRTSRQSTQSTATAAVDESLVQANDDPATEEGDSMMSNTTTTSKAGKSRKRAPGPKGSTKRTRKGTQRNTDTVNDSLISQQLETDLDGKSDSGCVAESGASHSTDQTKPRRQVRSSTKTKSLRGKKVIISSSTAPQLDLDASVQDDEACGAPAAQPPRTTRGRKRMSDGSEKVDQDSVVAFSPPAPAALEDGPRTAAMPKAKSKQAQRKQSDVKDPPQLLPPVQKIKPNQKSKKQKHKEENEEFLDENLDHSRAEPNPDPLHHTHDGTDPLMTEALQKLPEEPRQEATPPPGEGDPPDVSPTPQSSDAENQPPSSQHPSTKKKTPALSISPSKRNVIAGDQSSDSAWKPIDLEGVLLPSPSHAQLADKDAFNIETIIQRLSKEDKSLTVEDWIKKNAGQAEERLQQECERMIGRFEDEGNRALNSMEGIECA